MSECCAKCKELIDSLKTENSDLKKESENWEALCKCADKQIEELQSEIEGLQGFDLLQELKADLNNHKRWLDDRSRENSKLTQEKANYQKILSSTEDLIFEICEEECGRDTREDCPDCDCRFNQILKKVQGCYNEG